MPAAGFGRLFSAPACSELCTCGSYALLSVRETLNTEKKEVQKTKIQRTREGRIRNIRMVEHEKARVVAYRSSRSRETV